jgi:hypothetical protein
MNVKTSISIEITKDERVYSFVMPAGAPFGQAYDAAFEILQQIVEFSKKAADSAKPADADSQN